MYHSLEELESIIDKNGINNFLEDIFRICSQKAEHIRTNWQDHKLAEQWDKLSRRIDNAIGTVEVK